MDIDEQPVVQQLRQALPVFGTIVRAIGLVIYGIGEAVRGPLPVPQDPHGPIGLRRRVGSALMRAGLALDEIAQVMTEVGGEAPVPMNIAAVQHVPEEEIGQGVGNEQMVHGMIRHPIFNNPDGHDEDHDEIPDDGGGEEGRDNQEDEVHGEVDEED